MFRLPERWRGSRSAACAYIFAIHLALAWALCLVAANAGRSAALDRLLADPVCPDPARMARAQLRVGDLAPDFVLSDPNGQHAVHLASLVGRPVVLIFGSYT